MSDLSFASDFPQPTRDQWLKLVDGVLKGAPFDKTLVVQPRRTASPSRRSIRRAEGRSPVIGRAPGRPWQVLARIDHPSAAAANAQALTDLRNGATGLHVVFAGSAGANGFGLADGSPETVAALFADVVLEAGIRIELDLSMDCKGAAEALMALVAASGVDPAQTDIAFGYDPLGQMALHGGAPLDWPALAPQFGRLAGTILQRGFRGSVCSADGRIVHAAGGSEAQELAFAAGERARLLARDGGRRHRRRRRGRRAICFRLAADADQFLTIAKIPRAAPAVGACGGERAALAPAPRPLHAETAWRMMTRRDPWVNMLRATVAAFSAGVGGADAVSVLPFTRRSACPTRFARRVARNTQLVLLEESNLARVADPAAGSGGIEALTDELAGAAWALFQEIEAAGGLAGRSQTARSRPRSPPSRGASESVRIARRKDPLTGTASSRTSREAPVAVDAPLVAVPPPAPSARSSRCRADAPGRAVRGAARRAADAAPARGRTSSWPTRARLADFTARATFAENFFEAGGIAARSGRLSRAMPPTCRAGRRLRGIGRDASPACARPTRVYAEQAEAAAAGADRPPAQAPLRWPGRPARAETLRSRGRRRRLSPAPAATCWRRCRASMTTLGLDAAGHDRQPACPDFAPSR